MGVEKLCVVFDKPDKVYHPEETVTGRVELVIKSEVKIKSIELKIKGKAKCKFAKHRTAHSASEVYIKNKQILIGGRDEFKLPVGKHHYRFAVKLPLKAPSSFNGTYGDISYYGRAKIDIPLAFDRKERTAFFVTSPLNLNLFPYLRKPCKDEKTETFCCLWCAGGPLTISVRLPKIGFASFESIPICVEVDNASNVAINAVHVYLKRIINYIDGISKHDEDSTLQKLRLGGVDPGRSYTWSENFTIPPITFPNLNGCTIINMNHELQIEADASGMHCDLDMYIPVTIGDIPLSEDPNAPIVTPGLL